MSCEFRARFDVLFEGHAELMRSLGVTPCGAYAELRAQAVRSLQGPYPELMRSLCGAYAELIRSLGGR